MINIPFSFIGGTRSLITSLILTSIVMYLSYAYVHTPVINGYKDDLSALHDKIIQMRYDYSLADFNKTKSNIHDEVNAMLDNIDSNVIDVTKLPVGKKRIDL